MGNCKSSSPADSAGGEAVKSGPKEVSCRVVLIDRHTDDHGAVMFQVSPAFDDVRVPATRSTRSGVIAALSQQHVDWEYSWQGQGPPPQHGSRWGRHCDCTPPAKSPRRLSLSPLKKRKSAASIEEEDDGPYPCQDPSMCLLRSNRAMNTSTPGAVWLKVSGATLPRRGARARASFATPSRGLGIALALFFAPGAALPGTRAGWQARAALRPMPRLATARLPGRRSPPRPPPVHPSTRPPARPPCCAPTRRASSSPAQR